MHIAGGVVSGLGVPRGIDVEFWKEKDMKSKILVFLGMFATTSLYGADILPVGPMDPGAQAGSSSASLAPKGQMNSAIAIEGSDATLLERQAVLSSSSEENEVLRDSQKASLLFGFGISKSFELSLGLHGSNEIAAPSYRRQLFESESSELEKDEILEDKTRATAFSGASLFGKIALLNSNSFKLALAPFVETGSGERATYTFTRSVNPKAGWVLLTSYEQPKAVEVHLNMGYRYRQAEVIGDMTIRNEAFGSFYAGANLTRDLGIFTGLRGRRLMVAENSDVRAEDSKLNYRGRDAGEWSVGSHYDFKSGKVSVYYAQKVKKSAGFGFGNASAGLKVSYEIGNWATKKPRYRMSETISGAAPAKKPHTKNPEAVSKPKKPKYPEFESDNFDPLSGVEYKKGEKNDFSILEKPLTKEELEPGEDQKVSAELERLRAQERKAEQENKARMDRERELLRKQAVEQEKEDAELLKEWMNEASEQLNEEKLEITDEEMNWDGLGE